MVKEAENSSSEKREEILWSSAHYNSGHVSLRMLHLLWCTATFYYVVLKMGPDKMTYCLGRNSFLSGFIMSKKPQKVFDFILAERLT